MADEEKKDGKVTLKIVRRLTKPKIDIEECENNFPALLNKIPKAQLLELLDCNDMKMAKASRKPSVIFNVLRLTEELGREYLLSVLLKEKNLLGKIYDEITGKQLENPGNNPKTKEVMEKLLKDEKLQQLLSNMKLETLHSTCEKLGFKEKGSKDDVIEGLLDELQVIGAREAFDQTLHDFVKEVLKSLSLPTTGTKLNCIARLLGQVWEFLLVDSMVLTLTERRKLYDEVSKASMVDDDEDDDDDAASDARKTQLAPIQPGITKKELSQYFKKELKHYCKMHFLKRSGSVKELVDLILQHLESESTSGKRPREDDEKEDALKDERPQKVVKTN